MNKVKKNGLRAWWAETREVADRAQERAEEKTAHLAVVVPFPPTRWEQVEARPGPGEYACYCGAIDRQDCYCWDRRPAPVRTAGILGVLGFVGTFWFLIFRWVFGG